MERNWLIRTSQDQILGPVAKAKVVEFLQKGALGLNDEVSSGNGYWFSLKEKDLVEKYLYGDVPQGYNPISESKSFLSRRENPDLTTSLNNSPANKTQVLQAAAQAAGVLPPTNDLEYPDLTLVNNSPALELKAGAENVAVAGDEAAKLPTQDDLEFPDMGFAENSATSSNKNSQPLSIAEKHSVEIKTQPEAHVAQPKAVPEEVAVSNNGSIVYPKSDDLAYPDMEEMASLSLSSGQVKEEVKEQVKEEPEEEDRDFTVVIPRNLKQALEKPAEKPKEATEAKVEEKSETKRAPKKDFKKEIDESSGLTLVSSGLDQGEIDKAQKAEAKKSKEIHFEEKKLLHERKVKASELLAQKIMSDDPKDLPERTMPDHLKKRNDNYLMYILVILLILILCLFFYYYRTILNKPLPV